MTIKPTRKIIKTRNLLILVQKGQYNLAIDPIIITSKQPIKKFKNFNPFGLFCFLKSVLDIFFILFIFLPTIIKQIFIGIPS